MHLQSATSANTVGTGMLAISTWLPQLRSPPCHEPTNVNVYVSLYVIAGLEAPKDANLLYETTVESLKVHHTDQFKFLDKATIITKEDYAENSDMSPNPWTLCSITKVKEVKMIRLLPIWATTTIFWTTYAQIITFSEEQASTMDRHVGSFEIPFGSLTVFFVAVILISLAVYDRVIIPLCKKFRGKPGFTNLQRIGIGLFLSTLGMASAALAETKRLAKAKEEKRLFTRDSWISSSHNISPKGMKTMSTGVFLTTLPLGFFMSSLLVSVVKTVTAGDDVLNGVDHRESI
ncbi:hypothetical protein BUALT_Bualt02G0248100 [Buddleja alternifolia]|uniref:Uncharacterized protein n=1 Tax=Buddleja alternifolia TaxID=168488 RepID=A0AAV6Y359_9LAMI|nr:hypothetical protein BUALT_Bualt02G0248100 [Buddleja alternifolia]